VSGIFGSAGQSCVAGSRLFIQRTIYDEVLKRLVERTRKIVVAAPDTPGVEVGPLASFEHRDKVHAFVERARAEGGQILCGGHPPKGEPYEVGAYYLPTIITDLPNDSNTCQQEAF